MKQSATESVGDGAAWLLAALGVTFSSSQYFGGLFFAMACAMITRHWFPEKDRREVWITLLAAFIVSTIGAQILIWKWPSIEHFPVQMLMALLGLSSRVIVTLIMKVMLRTEARSDELAEKIIDKGISK